MPINELIARGFKQPQFLSLADIKRQQYSDEQLKMQTEDMQRQAQSGNALRDIFRQPGAMDPQTGAPSQNALAQMFQVDPGKAMALQEQMVLRQQRQEAAQASRVHTSLFKLQIDEKQAGILNEVAVGSQAQFDQLIESGVPKDQAVQRVSEARAQRLDELAKSGSYAPGQLDKLRGPFNPEGNAAFIKYMPQYKSYLADRKVDDKPPTMRTRIDGENEVQEQFDPATKTWNKLGSGPRFARQIAAAPGLKGDINTSWDAWSEEEKNAFANEASRDRTMLANIGRGSQGAKLLLDVNRRIINMQMESGGPGAAQRRQEFRADSNSLNKLTQTFDAITAFENTAIGNGKVLVDLAKKVDKTGIPVVERWIRAGRQNIYGDEDVSAFNAQITLFGNEAAKIISNPSMSGVLTDSSRHEVQGFLPQKASAKQIERVVNLLEGDFGRRKKATEDQMNDIRDRMTKGYAAGTKPGAGGSGTKINAATQQERDTDSRQIMQDELTKAESQIAAADAKVASANTPEKKQEAQAARKRLDSDIAGIKRELGRSGGKPSKTAGKVTVASKDDLQQAIKDGRLKSGDRFFDPDGGEHKVK